MFTLNSLTNPMLTFSKKFNLSLNWTKNKFCSAVSQQYALVYFVGLAKKLVQGFPYNVVEKGEQTTFGQPNIFYLMVLFRRDIIPLPYDSPEDFFSLISSPDYESQYNRGSRLSFFQYFPFLKCFRLPETLLIYGSQY